MQMPLRGTALVWLRDDLRLADNPAIAAAAPFGQWAAVYIYDESLPQRSLGAASKWWLHHSLSALAQEFVARGGRLILRRGSARVMIPALSDELGATSVFWNRRTPLIERTCDAEIKADLRAKGISPKSFCGNLLVDPATFRNGSGTAFKVFTPFWRAALPVLDTLPPPLPAPDQLQDPGIASDLLDDWALLPKKHDWAGGLRAAWHPGEAGAHARLRAFLETGLVDYADGRDFPARAVTSRLSAHLRFGEISPLYIWHATKAADAPEKAKAKFLAEIGWREFSHSLLFHFPELATRNFNPSFDAFPWGEDEAAFTRWIKGQTGIPIIDAGMRELWQTGNMHNRVRMIVASFLTKHLLIDWRRGEQWFWETLVDADPASNPASWQWVAGSGADAAPYFRVFNPVLQGEKFDGDGTYVRQFVPELAGLPDKWLHAPWEAPIGALIEANVRLGLTYPLPLIDLGEGRNRALAAFEEMKS